ncbi:hypothetical protein J3R83DRAFT_447 [Lanmaoa asiatica]|nr:hypothetical protein J3R83DRAFT_447 [Lanmaoa asiatica]
MVFTKLSVQEKDAFFGLLDEYFQSRPELFGQSGNSQGVGGTGISTAAATSVVQRALAGGNATSSWSGGATAGGGSASGKSNNPYAGSMVRLPNSADVAHAVTVGRVAAASLAFSGAKPADLAPSLPRRAGPNNVPTSTALERVGTPGMEVDKLVTKKASFLSLSLSPLEEPDVV